MSVKNQQDSTAALKSGELSQKNSENVKMTQSRSELKKSIREVLEADPQVIEEMEDGLAKRQVEKIRAL